MIRARPLRRGRLRPRRKTRKGQVPEAVLDALWGKWIHQRDARCRYQLFKNLNADCWGPLQAHHVYSKKYRQVRWDPEDGILLCARHHMLMHDAPVLAGRFYEELLGREKLDWLWAKARAKGKIDRAAVKAYLEGKV